MQSFFYDNQIRRWLLQFTRAFSMFEVEYGYEADGSIALLRVPIRYGDASRQAQTVLQNNSASSLPSCPLMTYHITGMEYNIERLQEPYFIDKVNVRQRTWDDMTQTYQETQAQAFTVDRMMPAPYDMKIRLDVWTSNTNQQWQLFEQMVPLFNPALELQSTDNFLDWTSLSYIYLENVTYTSRTVPQGTEDPINIMSFDFKLPVWITLPARVRKLGVIQKIIANVFTASGDLDEAVFDGDLLNGTRIKVTPYNYQVLLIGNQLQCLKSTAIVPNRMDPIAPPEQAQSNLLWHEVVNVYGALNNGVSQIRLDNQFDGSTIVGTVSYNPIDDRFLIFNPDPDTLPANTLPPVDAIIDPQRVGPDVGLPSAVAGQRYLLINNTGSDSHGGAPAWAGAGNDILYAKTNDIIQYSGEYWYVAFEDAHRPQNTEYVTNLTTGIQYRWTDGAWYKSYEGLYMPGDWALVL